MACDANTQVMLHLNVAGTTITDSSPNAYAGLSCLGNAIQSAAQAKFGAASLLLDGTGDMVDMTNAAAAFDFGAGQFTVEMWVRWAAAPASSTILYGTNGAAAGFQFYWNGANRLDIYCGGTLVLSATTMTSVTLGTWVHYACDRDESNVVRIYENGVVMVSATKTNSFSGTDSTARLGGRNDGYYFVNGYIDEFRVSNVARYAGAFTPQTAEFCGGTIVPLAMDHYRRRRVA